MSEEGKKVKYFFSGIKRYVGDDDYQFFRDRLELTREEMEEYGQGKIERALEGKIDKWSREHGAGRGRKSTVLYFKKLDES